ncbi:cysteine desulfurase [Paenibacillus selenitireducens]|uniref:cysteine desulfurase n=1 Tax=Paenibacillus selenitireducens TaxID=1324314 RepID=A0A1T2XIF0_9BACL|nr:aminotransferase class V-fold PLP-dependent enzyme [Paenibacillus selenitireducens]OPA79486.1 cysteine desulfurase [Paenibacillus selenitireducens]
MDENNRRRVIYMDHAATSWPKPEQVLHAMQEALTSYGANPGRGSHTMAVQASRVIFQTRRNLAKLFGIRNPNDIAFTMNTTMALNMAIKGVLHSGDHVIVTSIEHNSVRRPLEYLKKHHGIEVTYLQSTTDGQLDVSELERSFQPHTKLVICSHSSNLLGTILPIAQIGKITHARDVLFLVDAAQSAGILPIDVEAMNIDLLAFPGHKGLLGPQGTGGLYISPEIDLEPLLQGGTGSRSEDIEQPSVRPDRYEAGTPNTVGIAGLNEGVKFILAESVDKIHTKEWTLTQRLMKGLESIPSIQLLGPACGEPRTGIVSFIAEGVDASEMAFRLDREYQIAVRSGMHCTPLAHETAGTLGSGAVRVSIGYFTTEEEIEAVITAVQAIIADYLR